MKRKSVIALFIVVAMVGTSFAGCGRKNLETTQGAVNGNGSSTNNYNADNSTSDCYDTEPSVSVDDYASYSGDLMMESDATCADVQDYYYDNSVSGSTMDGYYNWLPEYPDYPVYEWNTESYDKPDETGYSMVQTEPLSTFAADVDTASYANVRRMIENGYGISDIPSDAVRPEEFLNYFSYDLNKPGRGEKFGVTTEIAECPWNTDHQLLFVGMTTQDLDLREAPDSNLVFLVDVSGSMSDENQLPLLQKSFDALIDELPENGTVSIVTYASGEEVVLSGESMKNKQEIKDAIDSLVAGGATNGERGIQKAYEIAENYFIKGGNNRVIMATDGDLNVGISDPDELEDYISEKKKDGVFLSVLGFGMGNYKDDRLERLADCGNGNYSYIDSFFEAKKVLVDEMGSTLVTVAKDVKMQVEFNPTYVNGYRLIGYENSLYETPSDDMEFACLVAEFAMILGRSEHLGNGTIEDVMDGCKNISGGDEYKDEFVQLVRMIAKRG